MERDSIYTYSRTHLVKICHELHMKTSMIDELIKVLTHFEKNNLHPVDYTLTKDFYPIISNMNGQALREIESSYTVWVKSCYKTDPKIFIRIFEYYKKPTLKKFIQLIFRECLI